MGTIFADDKRAALIIERIDRHGRLIVFAGQSQRISQSIMFGKHKVNTPAGTSTPKTENLTKAETPT